MKEGISDLEFFFGIFCIDMSSYRDFLVNGLGWGLCKMFGFEFLVRSLGGRGFFWLGVSKKFFAWWVEVGGMKFSKWGWWIGDRGFLLFLFRFLFGLGNFYG